MPDKMATECTTAEELQQWHDEAYAEYDEALTLFNRKQNDKTKADYQEKRDQLVAGTQYWRQVGEQTGSRSGVGGDAYVEGEQP